MPESLPIKLKNTWPEAGTKYGFGLGVDGLCVEYNLLLIAEMAGKHIEFIIKGRKRHYRIAPERAKEVVKQFSSVYTRKHDRRPIAVVPASACERIYAN